MGKMRDFLEPMVKMMEKKRESQWIWMREVLQPWQKRRFSVSLGEPSSGSAGNLPIVNP